jgi:hypothetical protein
MQARPSSELTLHREHRRFRHVSRAAPPELAASLSSARRVPFLPAEIADMLSHMGVSFQSEESILTRNGAKSINS